MIRSLWKRIEPPNSALKPLTPSYLEDEHKSYVSELICALENPEILNIALSGGYGIGKSSILKGITEIYRKDVIELSLSTLAPITISEDEGLPKQATTPTNQIQREIVKQLLYRERPRKTPGSRFRRIERFRWVPELALAFVVGAAFMVIFMLTGWTHATVEALPLLNDPPPWIEHLAALGVGFLLAVFLRRHFYGRLDIKQVSAGAATITLDEKSVSYFDQYLDEIVYFFEISSRKIVIFEDIDRFNDAHIFETLRSLNSLLNSSPQVDGPIKFIYAIRDSIFDFDDIERQGRKFHGDLNAGDDPAQKEIIRSNRTKFFDLVIPVVPFINHRNARDLTARLLSDFEHSVNPELIDLASRYVPDMRLLKNVRNEFLIFRDRILSGDGEHLRLNESQLLAMMLYKGTHLADFEAIRLGKSNLDKLYESSRTMVASNIDRLSGEILLLQKQLATSEGLLSRFQNMGDKLIAHTKLMATVYGFPYTSADFFSHNGARKSEDDLRTEDFWRELAKEIKSVPLIWNRRGYGQQLTFSWESLQQIVGPIDLQSWTRVEEDKNLTAQKKKREDLRFIKSADIKDLIARNDLTIDASSDSISFDALCQSLFGQGLTYQLLRYGYIDKNYIFYTGKFYGHRVSTAATSFIIHHLDKDAKDIDFGLTGADVDAIVRERPHQLGDPALYNIDFLDHVLHSELHAEAATAMVASLARLGNEQKDFLQAYLSRGEQAVALVERLVPLAPSSLAYLAQDVDVAPELHQSLFSAALASLGASTSYLVNDAVSDFITANYQVLEVLTSEEQDSKVVDRIADVLSKAGVKLPDLQPLGKVAVAAFVKRNMYEVTTGNLRVVLGGDELLSLDVMRDARPDVYGYIRENVESYLAAVRTVAPSVRRHSEFASIIDEVASINSEAIELLIKQAAEECVVSDLHEVPEELWDVIANNLRLKSSGANIAAYLAKYGEVDESLAATLRASEIISDSPELSEQDRIKVAYLILAARNHLSASIRATLCESLNLEDYLDSSAIEPEEGGFFPKLVEKRVVSDDAATYARLAAMSWETKELYISNSGKFSSYMSPELIGGDLSKLLESKAVSVAIKSKILAGATSYADESDAEGLRALGALASRDGVKIAFDLVERLAKAGFDPRSTLKLLRPHLDDASVAQVSVVLQALGERYADITSVGTDRPKLPATPELLPVLDFLIEHGVVNSYAAEGAYVRVNKKHK